MLIFSVFKPIFKLKVHLRNLCTGLLKHFATHTHVMCKLQLNITIQVHIHRNSLAGAIILNHHLLLVRAFVGIVPPLFALIASYM